MSIKNWCYGIRSVSPTDSIDDALFRAHHYRNAICHLEREKRERHEALLQKHAADYVDACSAVVNAENHLVAVLSQIQSERIKQRTKKPKGVKHLTTECKETRFLLKDLRAARKAVKLSAYGRPAVIAAMDQNLAHYKEGRAAASLKSGLYSGTKAAVVKSCESFSSGAPPRFTRYNGTGQLAVQLHGGLECDHATRANTLCYLDDDSRDGKLIDCYIRVASDERGRPVFAKCRVVMHRDLPVGKIKWAYLEKRKIADHVRYTLRLTIDCVDEQSKQSDDRWCAVHVGWIVRPNGLRVGLWEGCDGRKGEIVLSNEHCADYLTLDTIRSTRDVAFNEARDRLREWMRDRDDLPEWMIDGTSHIAQWKSPQRLAGLVLRWRDNRIDGDDDVFDAMNLWRKADKKRWQHSSRLSARICRRRDNQYRNLAYMLSQRYGVCYVGKIDAKKLTENSTPDELERDNTAAHRHAKWAAVSTLIAKIGEKFPERMIAVDTINLSRECHKCGHIAPESKPHIQCNGCGATWHRDDNALVNTIARGQLMQKSGTLLELQQQKELKEKKALEKLAKMHEGNRKKIAARKSLV